MPTDLPWKLFIPFRTAQWYMRVLNISPDIPIRIHLEFQPVHPLNCCIQAWHDQKDSSAIRALGFVSVWLQPRQDLDRRIADRPLCVGITASSKVFWMAQLMSGLLMLLGGAGLAWIYNQRRDSQILPEFIDLPRLFCRCRTRCTGSNR